MSDLPAVDETALDILLEALRLEGRQARDEMMRRQQDQVERISLVLVASSIGRNG